jgi:hypothetical protein
MVSSPQRCPAIVPGIVSRTVAGETLLVPVNRGVAECDRVFILNQTGAHLWPLLDGTRDVDALVQSVVDGFSEVEEPVARADVTRYLSALEERGLIHWEASA